MHVRTVLPAWRRRAIAAGFPLAAILAILLVAGAPVIAAWLRAAGGDVTADPARVLAASSTVTTVVVHNAKHLAITSSPAGSAVHTFVSVAGAGGVTGSVTVSRYTGGTCANSPVATSSAVALTNGAVDVTAFSVTPLATGQISFKASYLGNATFTRSTSACVALTIVKATPNIAFDMHDAAHNVVSSVTIGQSAHARIVLTGPAGIPTGDVTVKLHNAPDCTTFAAVFRTSTVGATGILEAPGDTFGSVASRFVDITYAGNAIYNSRVSVCKPISWVKATPTVTLVLHDKDHDLLVGEQLLGRLIHASSTFSGSVGLPTGAAEVRVFGGLTCTGSFATVPIDLSTGASDDATKTFPPVNAPSSFSYQVKFLGDAKYNTAISPCRNVSYKAAPTLTDRYHDAAHVIPSSIVVGSPVHMLVELEGAFGPVTGVAKVDFNMTACFQPPTVTRSLTLVNGASDSSASEFVPPTTGTLFAQVRYSGDVNYLPRTGFCVQIAVVAASASQSPPTPTTVPTAGPPPTPDPSTGLVPTPTPNLGGSAAPGDSLAPGTSLAPGATPIPGGTLDPGSSSAPGTSPGPAGSGGSFGESLSPGQAPGGTTGSGGPDLFVIVLLLAAVGVVVGGGWYLGRRRREPGS